MARPRKARGCDVTNCRQPHRARGLCSTHYDQWRTHGETRPASPNVCQHPGCGRPHKAKGLCRPHYDGTKPRPVRPHKPKVLPTGWFLPTIEKRRTQQQRGADMKGDPVGPPLPVTAAMEQSVIRLATKSNATDLLAMLGLVA